MDLGKQRTNLTPLLITIVSAFLALILRHKNKDTEVNFTPGDILVGFSVGHVVYCFFTAVQLPFLFKYGGIKGRFFTFIPFLGIFSISEIAKRMSPDKLAELSSIAIINNPYGMLVSSILFSIIIYCISVGISQKIFCRLE